MQRAEMDFTRTRRATDAAHGLVLAGLLLAACVGTAASASDPTPVETGYRQWMLSLESTMAAREKAGLESAGQLFPFAQDRRIVASPTPYRYLLVSRALEQMEDAERNGNAREGGTFPALSMARNYARLGEFESALGCYETAARLDTSRSYAVDIARESLAVAVALDDSAAVQRRIINTVGTAQVSERRDEFVLACRYLIGTGDHEQLSLIVKKLAGQIDSLDGELRYWLAFSLVELGRGGEAVPLLEDLLAGGGLSNGLDERQRAWVLSVYPDRLVEAGRYDEAARLYAILAGGKLDGARDWGAFMGAQIAFMQGRYLESAETLRDLCGRRDAGRVGQRACEMLPMAEKLGELRKEGEPYGAAAYYRP